MPEDPSPRRRSRLPPRPTPAADRARASPASGRSLVARGAARGRCLPAVRPGPDAARPLADPPGHVRALHHGQDIYNFEKTIGIDWEKGLQNALLSQHWLVKTLGGYYGGAHFVVTIGVLVWLMVRRPERYRFWRSVLFLVTMVAVAIFIFYPGDAAAAAAARQWHGGHVVRRRRAVVVQPRRPRAHLRPVRTDAEPAPGAGPPG